MNTAIEFKKFLKKSFEEKLLNEILKEKDDELFKASIINYKIEGFYLQELDNNDIGITLGVTIETEESGFNYKEIKIIQPYLISGILKLYETNMEVIIKKSMKINNIEKYRFKNNIVPYITLQQMEDIALKILTNIYPEGLKGKAINPYIFAERLGLTIKGYSYLDKHIMGSIFFEDYYLNIAGPDGNYYATLIKKNTLMLNSILLEEYNYKSLTFTIMHECVHYLLHKRAFLLECILNNAPKILQCMKDDNGIIRSSKRDSLTIEWQANSLAPKLILPAKAVKELAIKRLKEYMLKNPHHSLIDYYEAMMTDLASYFGVYQQAIKLRLIELGFQFPLGCFITVDGNKIEPHVCKKGFINKYQTFCIGVHDAISYISCLQDTNILNSFIYVDSHFVLNSNKYLIYINGIPHLNIYARTHMDQCAIKFDIDFIANTNKRDMDYRSFRLLNRTKDSKTKIEVKGLKDINSSLGNIDKDEMHRIASEAIELSMKMHLSSTGACLHTIKKYYGYTNDDLINKSGLSPHTIKRYLRGDSRYDRKNLIRLLLSLNIPGNVIDHVLRTAGIVLTLNFREDSYLAFVIANRWTYPLEENVEFLKEFDIEL